MTNTRFVALYGLALLSASAAFVVHLTLRNQNISLGYEVEGARNDGLRLRNQINHARLELAVRRSPDALEMIARNERGMVEPDHVSTLVVGGAIRPPRLSGRPR